MAIADKHERTLSEAAWRESEDRYRILFESSLDAMMVIAPSKWNFISANPATLELFGVQTEAMFMSLAPWSLSPATQPDGRPSADKARELIAIALREGSHGFEWRHRRLDGREFPAFVLLTRLKVAGQDVVQATVRDLTLTKQAMSALRDSEEQLDRIFNSASNAMALSEPGSGRILRVNDTWVRDTGVSREDAVGQSALARGLWAIKEERDACVALLAREGRLREFEGTLLLRGVRRQVAINAEVVELRRSHFVLWEFRDITVQKQAEETLRRYEVLAGHSRDILLFVRRDDGRILDANAAGLEAYGYSREELLSLSIHDLRAIDTREAAAMQMAAADSAGLRFETVHQCKDGSTFPVEVNACGATIGGVRTLMSVVRDISERKRAEEQIALLKHSIDVHYDAAYWTDSEGKFIYVNEAGYKALGLEPGELIGKPLGAVNAKATADRMKSVWDVLRKQGHYRNEGFHRRKDGSEFPVEVLTSYVRFGGKEYTCGFARDMTEQKCAEEEKIRLTSQLQQAQKMESVGRLAGGVAHDFNNMLGVILGHCELALEKGDPSGAIHGDLVSIQAAAQRSADLTRQLLAFARRQTVAPKIVNLNDLVAGMLKMVRRLVGEDIKLEWRAGENVWPIKIDPSQIDQVLANLCVNARDAISNVGQITIETGIKVVTAGDAACPSGAAPGDYVWLAVRDDGCGMAPSTLAHVFEPFFTTKEAGKGTGLGLATVYGIVKQNDGFIDLRSGLGQGTAITIYLPRHVGKSAHDGAGASAETIGPGQATILLVEDEAALLDVAQGMLEKRGYKVLGASTPGQALQLAREYSGNIDLLITDVVMPEMNGRDLAKSFLSMYPQAKCLFMSGYTADVIAHQGILDEGVFFIQKPFSANTLAATVRGVLDAGRRDEGASS
jgi:two-component system cell cycle sensor histidine kinase/response regulator CckA